MKTGLCSITFRQWAAEDIIELAASASLDAIEWGGDVHVPAGASLAKTEELARTTCEAGLFTSSYGSYYNIIKTSDHPGSFEPVLDVTQALGAPIIRVWTSGIESAAADNAYFTAMARRAADLAAMAAERDLTVALEFHRNSLTDTAAAARRLIEDVGMDNVRTYWQPLPGREPASYGKELEELLPRLAHVHCFHWRENVRLTLDEGRKIWRPLLAILAQEGFANTVLLEFTRDDDPDNMRRDAATLKEMVAEAIEEA